MAELDAMQARHFEMASLIHRQNLKAAAE